MKFFTFDWWSGNALDDFAPNAYEAHLRTVEDRLPAGVRQLIAQHSLHDGHLLTLTVVPSEHEVRLSLEVYSSFGADDRVPLSLVYHGVALLQQFSYCDDALGGPGGLGDLGYDEWHLTADGLTEHRLLFSSGTELLVQFQSLTVVSPNG